MREQDREDGRLSARFADDAGAGAISSSRRQSTAGHSAAIAAAADATATAKPGVSNPLYGLPTATVIGSVAIPLPNGAAPRLSVFSGLVGRSADHFALTFAGETDGPTRVRLHSSCITGDIFGSMRCDCGPQLHDALVRFSREGGILLYLQQEGRGIGLAHKIAAYGLQDAGADTFEANRRIGFPGDLRDYRIAAQMLFALNLRKIRLLTNNPDKVAQLERWGIEVSVEATLVSVNEHNKRYLAAKRDLAGHGLVLTASEGER